MTDLTRRNALSVLPGAAGAALLGAAAGIGTQRLATATWVRKPPAHITDPYYWIALFDFGTGGLAIEIWREPYGTHYPNMFALLGPFQS